MEDFLKDKLNKLNHSALLSFIKKENIEIVNAKIYGAVGISTPEKILLDESKLNCFPDHIVYFTVLHEIFHYKRIKQLGDSFFLKQFLNKNFEEFHKFVVNEENSADRYGRLMYFKFNGIKFPIKYTQMLHDEFNANRYKTVTKQMFELFQNMSGCEYKKLYEEFIIK